MSDAELYVPRKLQRRSVHECRERAVETMVSCGCRPPADRWRGPSHTKKQRRCAASGASATTIVILGSSIVIVVAVVFFPQVIAARDVVDGDRRRYGRHVAGCRHRPSTSRRAIRHRRGNRHAETAVGRLARVAARLVVEAGATVKKSRTATRTGHCPRPRRFHFPVYCPGLLSNFCLHPTEQK